MADLTSAQWSYANGVIVRGGNKTKRADFRDKLIPAYAEHYAMIHGAGGKKYAASSNIGLYVSDTNQQVDDSKGGTKALQVSYNLPPAFIRAWHEVASRVFTSWNESSNPSLLTQTLNREGSQLYSAMERLGYSTSSLYEIFMGLQSAVNDPCIANTPLQTFLLQQLDSISVIGNEMNNISSTINQVGTEMNGLTASLDLDTWSFKDMKGNPYTKDSNGLADAFSIQISYNPIGTDGKLSNHPWYVSITNGRAPLTEYSNGAITFKASEMKGTKNIGVNFSRYDMFKMLDATVRYIDLWEKTVGQQLVGQGVVEHQNLNAYLASSHQN